MRILVCGGRDYADLYNVIRGSELWLERKAQYEHVHDVLNHLCNTYSKFYNADDNWLPSDIVIIHGAARGADSAASDFAVVHWCQIREYKANWRKHGKSAGPIRNRFMLDDSKPDLVVAFPGGAGTRHMVEIATKAGVKVMDLRKP